MSNPSSLFRQEVLVQLGNREFGKALIQSNSWASRLVLIAVMLVMSALILLVITRYKETETVRGILVASDGAHRVVAPITSTVDRILVDAGDKVVQGQVLAALTVATFDRQGNNTQQDTLEQLQIQRQLLLDEQTLQQRLFQQQQRQLLRNIEASTATDELLDTESALLRSQLQLSTENRDALETLANGRAVSRIQLQQAQLEHLSFQLRVQQAEQRRQANRILIDSQQAELADLQLVHQQDRLRSEKELQQLDLAISQVVNQSQLTVVAETDGVVSTIAVAADEHVHAQQPLFYITSQPETLTASLYVPSRVLGQMYPGQELLLNYDAFDFQYFGRYRATVSAIDRASLDPREHLLPLPEIQEPVFRVTAQIDQPYVEGPDIYRLQSGMLFSADVVTADMSLLAFMFRPVLRMWAKLS